MANLKKRNCNNDECKKEFDVMVNGALYCSPECKRSYTAKRRRADYQRYKCTIDERHERVDKARKIYRREGGLSYVRELGENR